MQMVNSRIWKRGKWNDMEFSKAFYVPISLQQFWIIEMTTKNHFHSTNINNYTIYQQAISHKTMTNMSQTKNKIK